MAKKSGKKRKKSALFIVCIVVWLFLFICFVILLFLAQDFSYAISLFITVVTLVVAIIALKKKNIYVYSGIVVVLLVIDALLTCEVVQKNSEEESVINIAVSAEENGSVGENEGDVGNVERTLQKEFRLQDDHFIKFLDEYMETSGSAEDMLRSLIVVKLNEWANEWDTLALGDAGESYGNQRTLIDEIYAIRILPEMESITLKEKAVEDLEWVIVELDVAYGIWPNPELQREKALRYLENGDLCQKLGRYNEARKQYEEGIDVLWEGLEHSFQYGMLSTANNILDSLAESYEKIGSLPEIAIDDWDRGRAKQMAVLFAELSVNPDPE